MKKEELKMIEDELKVVNKEIMDDKYKTAVSKVKLIKSIRSGLGDVIKNNPSGVTIIKPSWFQRLLVKLKKIFTKF